MLHMALAMKLLCPSADDLKRGGIHVSQAIGLEKTVMNPMQAEHELTKTYEAIRFYYLYALLAKSKRF